MNFLQFQGFRLIANLRPSIGRTEIACTFIMVCGIAHMRQIISATSSCSSNYIACTDGMECLQEREIVCSFLKQSLPIVRRVCFLYVQTLIF